MATPKWHNVMTRIDEDLYKHWVNLEGPHVNVSSVVKELIERYIAALDEETSKYAGTED